MANNFGNISLGSNPFVGISDETVVWGGKLCAIKRVVVGGKIYDCGSGPNTGFDILLAINGWQRAALGGTQNLNVGGFSSNSARCDSLEITNSDYLGAEYRAEFLAYPDEWFSDIIGVLDPVDSVSISTDKNGLLTLRRTVSGRAASQGIEAVIQWIKSLNLETSPDLSKYGYPRQFALKPKNVSQTIDRINGSVSAEVTFVQNEGAQADSILIYTIDIDYNDREGIYTGTISGTIEGNTKSNIATIRNQVESIGAFELVNETFGKIGASATLSPAPSNLSFSENDETDTVSFSISYNSFPEDGQKKYFSFTIDYDSIRDVTTVTISGTVTFDSKIPLKERSDLINDIIKDYDFAGLCQEEFEKNAQSKNNPLNLNNPTSYSISINRGSDVSADVSVSYSNEDVLPDDTYISFDYDININPSYDINVPVQFLNGGGGVFVFKAKKRGSASIKGTAITKDSGRENDILSQANGILEEGFADFNPEDIIDIEKNITFTQESDNGYVYEFDIRKDAILNI
jgi:hypothetical protein